MTEPKELPDDPVLLKPLIRELFEQLRKSQRREESLQAKVDELARKLFGRKTEKLDPNQLALIDLAALGIEPPSVPETPVEPEVEAPPAKPRRPKRQRLSKDLPRRRVEHSLPEAERICPCCDEAMPPIREETHERLDYTPASFEVIEHVTFVYGCRKGCDEKIVQSKKPPQMVEKGLPGPGLLAKVAVDKYCDHLPLYRQERGFRRVGVDLSCATLGGWIKAISEGITPLVEHLQDELLRSRVIATDDTSVPVQKKGGTYRGRLWVYIGDLEYPLVLYDYTPTREGAGPIEFLDGYGGFLQADAYSGYDKLFDSERKPRIVEVGCWMHARRYFHEASLKNELLALEALAMIRELYGIERRAKPLDAASRLELRQAEAAPILDTFEAWVKARRLTVPPKSSLGKAFTYVSNQWDALRRYTTDGILEIDNGRSERLLRLVALGRKNWLFAGNDAGGRRAANVYTLTGTCHYHGWDPFAYLRWLFTVLPGLPESRLGEASPLAWAAENGLASKLLSS